MARYCYALDLVNDTNLMDEYKDYHKKIWPEVAANIKQRGIIEMEIWQVENHLFMIVETADNFDAEQAAKLARQSVRNQEWEKLMDKFQQPLPSAKEGEKWVDMEKIFDLAKNV